MSYVTCELYTYYEAFVFVNKSKMLVAGQKHKHVHKTLREKAQALKYIKKGLLKLEQNIMYQKIPYLDLSKITTKSCHD